MLLTQARMVRLALSISAMVALLFAAAPSWAGVLQIKDTQGLLTPADVAALRSETEALPFAVRVLTTGEYEGKAELDRYVHEQLTDPNMVVVGVDKSHRHTAVHFGTATSVPSSAFRRVEEAGNSSFREGHWRAGISAILSEGRDARTSSPSAEPGAVAAAAPARASASTAMWGLLAVLVVAGLIVFVGVTLARRARSGLLGGQAQQPPYPPNGNYPPGGPGPAGFPPGGAGGYPPGYGGPGYGGYGAGGGMGRNIAAAGLGGLVGYELGKMAGDHDNEPRGAHEAAGITGGADDDARSPDAGGASGGWGDDSSSQGDDWGGGGDDGGGDFGGGDSGGGGSDW